MDGEKRGLGRGVRPGEGDGRIEIIKKNCATYLSENYVVFLSSSFDTLYRFLPSILSFGRPALRGEHDKKIRFYFLAVRIQIYRNKVNVRYKTSRREVFGNRNVFRYVEST